MTICVVGGINGIYSASSCIQKQAQSVRQHYVGHDEAKFEEVFLCCTTHPPTHPPTHLASVVAVLARPLSANLANQVIALLLVRPLALGNLPLLQTPPAHLASHNGVTQLPFFH